MRLCRYGPKGQEKPALVDSEGRLRNLPDVGDIGPDQLTPDALLRIAALDATTLPLVPDGARIGVPVAGIGKIVAIGLNYRDHAIESNLPIP